MKAFALGNIMLILCLAWVWGTHTHEPDYGVCKRVKSLPEFMGDPRKTIERYRL